MVRFISLLFNARSNLAWLGDVLGIPVGRVYVRFADIPVWSVGDMLIDRRMLR